MDSEKKPKRPRIGSVQPSGNGEDGMTEPRYEKVNYPNDEKRNDEHRHQYQSRQGYQNRQVNPGYPGRQGNQSYQGYQNRQGYQGYSGYQGYQNYQQQNVAEDSSAIDKENTENLSEQPKESYQPRQGVYQPRPNYQNRQGGYTQGGYNQNRQGGYQNRQGGYNQNRQGGYQNRQGGYNQGGYNQGGYNQNRQGGYQNRQGGYNQGGYNQNRQGGYQNRQGGYNQGGYNQNRQGGYQQGGFRKPANNKMFTPRPRQIDYIIDDLDPNEEIRLNKFMANAGICSRREADEYITKGLVKVNGEVTTELGTKIKHDDVVEYDDKVVVPERKCYVLLNKPKDCVTTSDDPNGRMTVLDIVKNACKERIYPVGRLDRNTTGVLLLTNDGDLASKLTHPKFVKKKIYHVWTDKDISEEDMQRIADGIELSDGEIHADAISYVSETERNQAGIEIHSGRNRIVRRIFEHLGYRVTKLDRVYFAGLTKKNLPRGRWRYLTQEEVTALRTGRFE